MDLKELTLIQMAEGVYDFGNFYQLLSEWPEKHYSKKCMYFSKNVSRLYFVKSLFQRKVNLGKL
jgi:hypothetical protein